MKSKHLDFYMACTKDGILPEWGLCTCARRGLISERLLNIMTPSEADMRQLQKERKGTGFWGSGLGQDNFNRINKFTPLRQTIVLFMAAMAGELKSAIK